MLRTPSDQGYQSRRPAPSSRRCWSITAVIAVVTIFVLLSAGNTSKQEREEILAEEEAERTFLAKAQALIPKLSFNNPLGGCPAPPLMPPSAMLYDHVTINAKPNTTTFPKINILHLIDFETYDAVMDRWFARSQADFADATDLVGDAPVWGVGFPGYDSTKSIADNVEARYGRKDHFDAILPYYNGDQTNWRGVDPIPLFFDIRDLSKHGTIVIDRPHEMRDERRVPIIDHANVSIVLCPYANECYDYKQAYERSVLLVHQPHPVNVDLFHHPIRDASGQPVERSRDVLLAGSLEAPMYPLRHRLSLMIEDGKLPGYIRPHPGYPDIYPDEQKQSMGVNVDWLDNQLREFSADLGSSKICFVTASMWGYSVQKYGEAAAAGCMIIGTIPYDRQSDFREFVVEISNDNSDKKIANTLKYWLDPAREEERLRRTEKAQNYFIQKFSGRRYVEDVVMWIRLAQRGQKGLMLPYEWSSLPDPVRIFIIFGKIEEIR